MADSDSPRAPTSPTTQSPSRGLGAWWKAHRWVRRGVIGGAVCLVLFTATGFLVAPAVARRVGEQQLSKLLHRQVTIEAVRLNPFALSATVRGLRIQDRDGTRDLLAFKEVYANLELASLWKRGLVVKQARLVEPAIRIVRTAPDRYNFSDILDELAAPSSPAPPPPKKEAGEPARFSVSNIEILRGRIELDDRPAARQHAVTDLNLAVPFLSNFPYLVETFVEPAFSATLNGTRLSIGGRSKPFADSLESSIDINLAKVDLPTYLAYVPVKLRLAVRSAVLDTRLKVSFIQYRERTPRVDVAGTIALSALDVEDARGGPLVKLPRLEIAVASSDLL